MTGGRVEGSCVDSGGVILRNSKPVFGTDWTGGGTDVLRGIASPRGVGVYSVVR